MRVKYIGPAPLGGPDAGVRYADARPAAAAAPATIAASSAPVAMAPAESIQVTTLAPPAPVTSAPLAPLTGSALGSPPAAVQSVADGPAFRIQAGSFSNPDNAQRAAAQLAGTGRATVEPIQRGGTTLYRVMLPGPADEAEAYALRDKVASIGFADARVMQPF